MTRTTGNTLGRRALNRATLARQLLLRRASLPAASAVEHLVGMQAQAPNAPYVGLRTRLTGFRQQDLTTLLTARDVVRAPLLRATIHLVTATDALAVRPMVQPVLRRGLLGAFGRGLAGADLAELTEAGRALLDERPLTRAELGARLATTWPDHDPASLAYAVTSLVPTVQVPPRGLWGATGQATWASMASWLAGRTARELPVERLVVRYLAAFGPATVRDIQTWCGLTGLRAAVDRLLVGPDGLRTFADERGAELFDLPDAPRPDPDTPAPPRFLPEYDNLLLSHADRSRVITGDRKVPLYPGNGGTLGTFLVDGFWCGNWKITQRNDTATLLVEPFTTLSTVDRNELAGEGDRLLAFVAPEAARRDIEFAARR